MRGSRECRFARGVRTALSGIEEALYVIVGVLLLAAAVLVVVGTVSGLISSIKANQSAVAISVVVLDRILLTLIVAELLHTLHFCGAARRDRGRAFLVRRPHCCGAADSHHHGRARAPDTRRARAYQRAS